MLRLAIALVATFGCLGQIQNAVNPPAAGDGSGGTLTCAQIVETCDASCTQPWCLHGCTRNGTPEAQQQHDALLACGEQHGCSDEDCIRTQCPTEVAACQASANPS